MVKTKKFSRIAAMLLALVMLLSVVPFQSFAAEADPAELQLKDGTVALSQDMSDEQVKKALFDALVANPEGKDYRDYEWQYYSKGTYCMGGNPDVPGGWAHDRWAAVAGEVVTISSIAGNYRYWPIQHDKIVNAAYPVRVVGNDAEVKFTKVSSCNVTYNYDALKGSVLVDGSQVSGTVTGLSPAKDIYFTVAANAGYEVESVKANGVELQADNGVYSVLPSAETKIDVTFKEIGTLYNVTVNAGEGVKVTLNGTPVSGTVKVSADEKYTLVYTPDENTSVKSVKLDGADVTSDVSFSNYVGTHYVTFTGDAALEVESVAVSDELVLTEEREAGIVINADGSWNYDGIRANIIKVLVDKAKSVGVEFTQDNVEIFYNYKLTAPEGYTYLEDEPVPAAWIQNFKQAVAADKVKLRICFKGNDQFRPTDYVYVNMSMVDVQKSVIAIKNAPVVVLEEVKPGVIDYANLAKKVYDAAIDTENSLPKGMKFEEMIFTVPEVTTSGTYKVKAEYVGSTSYYASSTEFEVYFKVAVLPNAEIALKAPEISAVLNETKLGEFDVEALKRSVFDLAVNAQASKPVLSYDDVTITFNGDVTKGGKFTATISFAGSADYHGTSTTVIVNVERKFLPAVKVEAAFANLVLKRTADGGYNYDELKQDIFAKCLTVSGVDGLTWSDFSFKYKLYDMGGTIGEWQNFDFYLSPSYKYLNKGGNFEIKVSIPDSDAYHGTSVEFKINVEVAKREDTKVVIKSGAMDYTSDIDAVKAYIFNNLINFGLSNIPDDVTIDNFTFEYKANNFTAGDIPGTEWHWVPLEGKPHPTLAASYFKPIGGGTHKIRVRFTGTEEFLPYTSNEVDFTLNRASVQISLNQNYKYLDEDLPKDFVKTSVAGDFKHYYFAVDASSDTGIIYIDSMSGLVLNDFTGNVSFSTMLTNILGTGMTALAVHRDGLSRDQLVKLLSDSRMVEYLAGYDIDANAVNAILDVVNSVPANVTRFAFKMDQPTKPGVYTMFVVSTSNNFYTAVSQPSVFYVKYHTKGTKLVFVGDTDGLNSIEAKNFDFSAVVTKDGVPVDSSHVKYIYTGIRSNGLFYSSTKEPPRVAGIYTQTAWTGISGRYAFPKTRTFSIALL